MNDLQAAAAAAEDALSCLQSQAGDLTVASIRASATTTLYTATDWDKLVEDEGAASTDDEGPDPKNVAKLRRAALRAAQQGPPNLGSLWRTEAVSSALGTDLNNRFKDWADLRVTMLVGEPKTGFSELSAAAWTAAFAGSWTTWRQLTGQASRIVFTTSTDPDQCDAALRAMTRAGLTKEAKQASKMLWLNGPVSALKMNVAAIAAQPWSFRAEGPAFSILAEAGDLLDADTADAVIGRILTILRTKGPVRRIGTAWVYRWNEIGGALARLLFTAGPDGHEECAELVIKVFNNGSDNRVHEAVRIGNKLQPKLLTPGTRRRLVDAVLKGEGLYRAELLERLARGLPKATAALKELAAEGDKHAARSLIVIGKSAPENWATLGANSAPVVAKLVKEAKGDGKTRGFTNSVIPSVHDLTLSAFHTGNTRHWKIVTDALAAGVLPGEQMEGAVQFLATHFNELPEPVQLRVKRLAPKLRSHVDRMFDSAGFEAAVFALQMAASILDSGQTLAKLLHARHMSGVEFARLVSNVPTVERTAFILACTVDVNPHIRAQAAYGVVRLASEEPGRAADIETALMTSLELNDGCRMPLGAAAALKEYDPPGFRKIRYQLRGHPSSVVRAQLA
jgi:hypothetical protein